MKYPLLLLATGLLMLGACKSRNTQFLPDQIHKEDGQTPDTNAGAGKFSIDPPSGWQKTDTTINNVKIISLLSPAKSNEFRSNINVMTESIRDVSLDGYFDQSVSTMSKFTDNYSAGPKGEKEINGMRSKWMKYSCNKNGFDLDVLVYFVTKDGIAYVIMCTAPKGRIELYQAQFEEAVNSFRVS
ncbi:MAG TPA: hypothetical protein VE035_17080 [Puia sp.]|nr:hypothetical protein [Puia sp.]